MDDTDSGLVAAGRTPDGRFGAGNAGKPRGAKRRVTVAMDSILERAAEEMTGRLVDLAVIAAGDLTPNEARSIMAMLVVHKDIVTAGDHERRLDEIEKEMKL